MTGTKVPSNIVMSKKIFVTGGTGFIGSHVVKKLIARNYSITCLVRSKEKGKSLSALGATLHEGDITDKDSMREGMQGHDAVFHIAAWYELGNSKKYRDKMTNINVGGTKNICELVEELKIKRLIYCSTVAALGPVNENEIGDENHKHPGGYRSWYEKTKYEAHEYVKKKMRNGLPVTIVMPAAVYGPGDTSALGGLMKMYIQRKIPAKINSNGKFSFVHVDDVAEGIILAYERGKIGESYCLADKDSLLSINELYDLMEKLTGIPAPERIVSINVAKFFTYFSELKSRLLNRRPVISVEGINMITTNWAYHGEKAKRELNWKPRKLEHGLKETIESLYS